MCCSQNNHKYPRVYLVCVGASNILLFIFQFTNDGFFTSSKNWDTMCVVVDFFVIFPTPHTPLLSFVIKTPLHSFHFLCFQWK